jgi:tight adherence protein C
MSDLLLLISLAAIFAAITLVGVSVEISRNRRRRVVELLAAQVEPVTPVASVREHELARPIGERAVVPIFVTLGRVARRLTPVDVRERLARKLVLAGSPEGWDADRIAIFKIVGLVGGTFGGIWLGNYLGQAGLTYFLLIGMGTAGGYFLPDVFLNRAAEDRQKAIQRALPDTMDLLTISVEAGLGFDAALAQVREHVPGPLSEEISRMLQEVQLGVSRQTAFRHMASRSDVEELQGFVLAMIQADIFGISVSRVLRAQAKELRSRRRQRAERTAMQIPVKILFPMIFCVMPALFVVVIGPGALTIIENFSGTF